MTERRPADPSTSQSVGTVTCSRLGNQRSWLAALQSMKPNTPWPPGSRPVKKVVQAVEDTDGSDERSGTGPPSANSAARLGRRPAVVSARR